MSNGINAIKILGGLLGSGAVSSGTGANILNQVIGMATGGAAQGGGGGLGGLLGGLLGGGGRGQQQGGSGGGLGGMLGGLLGGGGRGQQQGGAQMGGGLGNMLGSLLGGGAGAAGGGALGGLLGAALKQYQSSQSSQAPSFDPAQDLPSGMQQGDAESQATLMIQAMINAAKADGRVDQNEQQKILGELGDLSEQEAAWLRQQIAEPLDVGGFARNIPQGMAEQVYAVSLMAIDLDSQAEAQYLDQLARGTSLSQQTCNQIHQEFGVQPIYS